QGLPFPEHRLSFRSLFETSATAFLIDSNLNRKQQMEEEEGDKTHNYYYCCTRIYCRNFQTLHNKFDLPNRDLLLPCRSRNKDCLSFQSYPQNRHSRHSLLLFH
uniref:Uncharacterized protein n=1 Tax=Amphimedon queenslandica TaxID=400682 RepID=A0A1X7VJL4_AMPQE